VKKILTLGGISGDAMGGVSPILGTFCQWSFLSNFEFLFVESSSLVPSVRVGWGWFPNFVLAFVKS
jgi:hypothetical protein